jgi:hydroxyethylthiazole kinase
MNKKNEKTMAILQKIAESHQNIKEKNPLVHHITNYVTVNDCANIVLAIGGSPVMADDIKEVEEMVSAASSLVLNIGTLNHRTIESMIAAGRMANRLDIPVILDPVGVGATTLRTDTAKKIIHEVKLAVVRGNMSEMKFLAGMDVAIKGVDSVANEEDGEKIAKKLVEKLGGIIAITGKTDIITDGKKTCLIDNGHIMLSNVTGTGCMTSSLIGTYCGAIKDIFLATIAGVMTMGLCGELAYQSLEKGEGIGTFKVKLFDKVYNLSSDIIMKEGKICYE